MHVIESFKEEWTHVHPIKPLDDKEHYMRITKNPWFESKRKKKKKKKIKRFVDLNAM